MIKPPTSPVRLHRSARVPNALRRPDTPPAHARPVPKHEPRSGRVIAATTAVLLALNLIGAPYYRLPIEARVRSPLHVVLKSSGPVGQTAGLAALAIFLFLWLYPLR